VYGIFQKLLAEFIGTFGLVFISAGSVCADAYLRSQAQHGIGILGVAAAYGLAMAALVSSLAHISGGHLNPAVTIAYWVTKRISTLDAIAYWLAQLFGATLAALALSWAVSEGIWRAVGLGTPDLGPDVTRSHGMVLEGIVTFLLVMVVFATIADPNGAYKRISGLAVGLTVMMGALVAGPFTGAAMNPARAFGPALVARHWQNHGVYWVGALAGGVLAGWIYGTVFLKQE
jgi:MIP family channel proteins